RRHLHQPEQRLEQRGLTGAVRSDDADQFAFLSVEVAAVQDVHAGDVTGDEFVDTQQRTLGGAQMLAAVELRIGSSHGDPFSVVPLAGLAGLDNSASISSPAAANCSCSSASVRGAS